MFDVRVAGVDKLEKTAGVRWGEGHVMERLAGPQEEQGFYPE